LLRYSVLGQSSDRRLVPNIPSLSYDDEAVDPARRRGPTLSRKGRRDAGFNVPVVARFHGASD
jgi:hypothetical protein